jgi:hypothetical protein
MLDKINSDICKMFVLISLAYTVNIMPACAVNIVPDGKTNTNVSTNGNFTRVSTATIKNSTGLNSFSNFTLQNGEVLNMLLPTGTDTLMNIVGSNGASISGILNTIKDNHVGGKLYFITPGNMTVYNNGVINTGALTIFNTTDDFVNNFFTPGGAIDNASFQSVLDNTVPIGAGKFQNSGIINAITNININSKAFDNYGTIQTGAVFQENDINIGDVVNLNGLTSGAHIILQNGDIVITCLGLIYDEGNIITDGGNNVNAGNIYMQGQSIRFDDEALLSAKGKGENSAGGNIELNSDVNIILGWDPYIYLDVRGGETSGDSGAITLTAPVISSLEKVDFKAYAYNGATGTVTINTNNFSPTAQEFYFNGANIIFNVDKFNSSGSFFSTRLIAEANTKINHRNSNSVNDSGEFIVNGDDITLREFNPDTEIYTFANNGYNSGNTTINTTDYLFINKAIIDTGNGDLTINAGDVYNNGLFFAPGDIQTQGMLISDFLQNNIEIVSIDAVHMAGMANIEVGHVPLEPDSLYIEAKRVTVAGNNNIDGNVILIAKGENEILTPPDDILGNGQTSINSGGGTLNTGGNLYTQSTGLIQIYNEVNTNGWNYFNSEEYSFTNGSEINSGKDTYIEGDGGHLSNNAEFNGETGKTFDDFLGGNELFPDEFGNTQDDWISNNLNEDPVIDPPVVDPPVDPPVVDPPVDPPVVDPPVDPPVVDPPVDPPVVDPPVDPPVVDPPVDPPVVDPPVDPPVVDPPVEPPVVDPPVDPPVVDPPVDPPVVDPPVDPPVVDPQTDTGTPETNSGGTGSTTNDDNEKQPDDTTIVDYEIETEVQTDLEQSMKDLFSELEQNPESWLDFGDTSRYEELANIEFLGDDFFAGMADDIFEGKEPSGDELNDDFFAGMADDIFEGKEPSGDELNDDFFAGMADDIFEGKEPSGDELNEDFFAGMADDIFEGKEPSGDELNDDFFAGMADDIFEGKESSGDELNDDFFAGMADDIFEGKESSGEELNDDFFAGMADDIIYGPMGSDDNQLKPEIQATEPGTAPYTPDIEATEPGSRPLSDTELADIMGSNDNQLKPEIQATEPGTAPYTPEIQASEPGTRPLSDTELADIMGSNDNQLKPEIQASEPGTAPYTPEIQASEPGTRPLSDTELADIMGSNDNQLKPEIQASEPGTAPYTPEIQASEPGTRPLSDTELADIMGSNDNQLKPEIQATEPGTAPYMPDVEATEPGSRPLSESELADIMGSDDNRLDQETASNDAFLEDAFNKLENNVKNDPSFWEGTDNKAETRETASNDAFLEDAFNKLEDNVKNDPSFWGKMNNEGISQESNSNSSDLSNPPPMMYSGINGWEPVYINNSGITTVNLDNPPPMMYSGVNGWEPVYINNSGNTAINLDNPPPMMYSGINGWEPVYINNSGNTAINLDNPPPMMYSGINGPEALPQR